MSRIKQADVDRYIRAGGPLPKSGETVVKPGKVSVGESLHLCIRGPGRAFWVHEYREPGSGRRRGYGLGNASEVTLASALKRRHRFDPAHRPSIRLVNPAGNVRQGHTAASGLTFAAALDAWCPKDNTHWSAKGVKARRRLAETTLAPLDVATISQADVLKALEGETPRQHTDKRGWLADLFSFAKAKGWRVGDNPAVFDRDTLRGLPKVVEGEHHATVPWSDLPALYGALGDDNVGRALRFLILTAARAGEVENATWSQIIGENGTTAWVYTVRKGKKPHEHRVPLSSAALALLGNRGKPGELIFGALPANALLNAVQAVRSDATCHGLRSTFKDYCSEHAVDDALSEIALSHNVGDKVRRAYARSDLLQRRRQVMEKYARFATGN